MDSRLPLTGGTLTGPHGRTYVNWYRRRLDDPAPAANSGKPSFGRDSKAALADLKAVIARQQYIGALDGLSSRYSAHERWHETRTDSPQNVAPRWRPPPSSYCAAIELIPPPETPIAAPPFSTRALTEWS